MLPLDALTDVVTARAPVPPARPGLPLPSLVWVSFAFRVREAGGGVGAGVGSASERAGSSFSVSGMVSGSVATVVASSSCSSSSESCIMTDPLESPRERPLVRRLDVPVAAETVRELGVAATVFGSADLPPSMSHHRQNKKCMTHLVEFSSKSMRASVLRLARTLWSCAYSRSNHAVNSNDRLTLHNC